MFEKVLNLCQRLRVYFLKKRRHLSFTFVTQGDGGVCISGNGKISIDSTSQLKSNTYLECSGGISIGRYFHCGRSLTIFSSNHSYDAGDFIPYSNTDVVLRPVVIEDFVWMGANVTICPGAHIGEGAIIGAGAVVAGDLESFGIYAGNPAVKIGQRDIVKFKDCKKRGLFF